MKESIFFHILLQDAKERNDTLCSTMRHLQECANYMSVWYAGGGHEGKVFNGISGGINRLLSAIKKEMDKLNKWKEKKCEIYEFHRGMHAFIEKLNQLSKKFNRYQKIMSQKMELLPPIASHPHRYFRGASRKHIVGVEAFIEEVYKKIWEFSLQNVFININKEEVKIFENFYIEFYFDFEFSIDFWPPLFSKYIEKKKNIKEFYRDMYRIKNSENEPGFDPYITIRIPYWFIESPRNLPLIYHEVIEFFITGPIFTFLESKAGGLENYINEEFLSILERTVEVPLEIIGEYTKEIDAKIVQKYFGGFDTYVLGREIITDVLSLCIAGIPYYFSLYLNLFPLLPLIDRKIQLPQASWMTFPRLYLLSLIAEDLVKKDIAGLFLDKEGKKEPIEELLSWLETLWESWIKRAENYKRADVIYTTVFWRELAEAYYENLIEWVVNIKKEIRKKIINKRDLFQNLKKMKEIAGIWGCKQCMDETPIVASYTEILRFIWKCILCQVKGSSNTSSQTQGWKEGRIFRCLSDFVELIKAIEPISMRKEKEMKNLKKAIDRLVNQWKLRSPYELLLIDYVIEGSNISSTLSEVLNQINKQGINDIKLIRPIIGHYDLLVIRKFKGRESYEGGFKKVIDALTSQGRMHFTSVVADLLPSDKDKEEKVWKTLEKNYILYLQLRLRKGLSTPEFVDKIFEEIKNVGKNNSETIILRSAGWGSVIFLINLGNKNVPQKIFEYMKKVFGSQNNNYKKNIIDSRTYLLFPVNSENKNTINNKIAVKDITTIMVFNLDNDDYLEFHSYFKLHKKEDAKKLEKIIKQKRKLPVIRKHEKAVWQITGVYDFLIRWRVKNDDNLNKMVDFISTYLINKAWRE